MKITSVIDNLDEELAAKLTELARTGRDRYEVVLDRIDGDHHETELHFRLVELTATQRIDDLPETYVSGLGGGPPVTSARFESQLDRMSILLASLIGLTKISPQVLGIPAGDKPLATRIRNYLRGY